MTWPSDLLNILNDIASIMYASITQSLLLFPTDSQYIYQQLKDI